MSILGSNVETFKEKN